MKNISERIRRLEDAVTPVEDERARAMFESMLEARRRRLGADYKPPEFPPESYTGCRTLVDFMIRTRHLMLQRERTPSAPQPQDQGA